MIHRHKELGVNSWQNKVYTFTAGVGQRVCIDTVGWLHGGFIFISNDAGYLVNCAYTVIAYNASATFHQTTIVNWNTGTVGAPTLSESGGNVILNTTGNAYCIYTLIRHKGDFIPYIL